MKQIQSLHIHQIQWHIAKLLVIILLIYSLVACSNARKITPSGTAIPVDKLPELAERSFFQIDGRKDDIEIKIKLTDHEFRASDTIVVAAVLINTTNDEFVIRRPDYMPLIGNELISVHGVKFMLINQNTKIGLERTNALTGFIEEGFPPPEAFFLIPANAEYSVDFVLTDIFRDIPVGAYSLQLIYTNDFFEAQSRVDSKIQYIDFDAWIGSISSNTEFFKIKP